MENDWIPTANFTPPYSDDYLVSFEIYGSVAVMVTCYDISDGFLVEKSGGKVKAWQFLPEAYKEC